MAITYSVHTGLLLLGLLAVSFSVDASPAIHKPPQQGKRAGGRMRGKSPSASNAQLRRDMREAVDEVLGFGHGIDQQGLEAIRRDIEPSWQSLTRSHDGRIDRRSLRYVVQRFFLRRHSLSIVGLEASHANSTHSEAALLMSYAPNYVRKVLEGDGAQRGFFMEDAVAMIAALMRLIQHSGGNLLEDVYKVQRKDYRHDLGRKSVGEIMEGFMLRWMLGDDMESVRMLEANATLKEASFEAWPSIARFAQGSVTGFEFARSHRSNKGSHVSTWNALRPHFSFADAEAIVGNVALSFGEFWESECSRTKDSLMSMDRSGTGRVKLADFHGAALDGEWRFSESKEYLRQLGVLDETSSWRGPQVVITNYVQAPSNCIISAEHYRVCCSNECERHMAELEGAIRAPEAKVEDILPVVERLSSGFEDDAPRLTSALKSQLKEIARVNSGKVPIHGRLFAQWLHYVFPLECPFPHKSGTTSTLTPLAFGGNYMASEEEMSSHAEASPADADGTGSEDEWMTQWSHEEELLAEELQRGPWQADFSTSSLVVMMVIGAGCLLVKSGMISAGGGKDVLPTNMKSHYI